MKKIYSFLLLGMAMGMPSGSMAQELSGVSIYINPGHGGFDSDDRNVAIYPFDKGDPKGFWESQSNLDKGFHLRDLLQERGAKVFMSRTQNRTEDDLSLSKIVAMANASDADFMLSIHSNAGVTSNMVLQLYAGKDPDDAHIYPTPTPYSEEGRAICTVMAQYLYSNEANVWGNRYSVR
ncbi:MAG: N-acetylmuramoyl-L-alanine amidase, partial [Bacteroidales bacterium]